MNFKNIVKNIGMMAGVNIDKNSMGLRIHNEKFYKRLIITGSIGLGESYMDGWWDCDELDEFFFRIIKSKIRYRIRKDRRLFAALIVSKLINQQTIKRSKRVVDQHYNLDVELFKAMLGKTMSYTCGYWKKVDTLDAAQYAKFELICRKLNLVESDYVLDVGSGFGGLAKYMTENYGCKVVGINISQVHHDYAVRLCDDRTRFYLCDYRDTDVYAAGVKQFDKIVSVGMFEAVGPKNYKTFFRIICKLLKNNGLFLLHTIGTQADAFRGDPWILKYIFPGGAIPTTNEITNTTDRLFVLEDWHNFGHDYHTTLNAWYQNFHTYWSLQKGKDENDPDYRMWRYYLLMCAGGFRARDNSLWQIVFSKYGTAGGYTSVR